MWMWHSETTDPGIRARPAAGRALRRLIAGLALVMCLCGAVAGEARAARPVLDWLEFDSRVKSAYSIAANPGDTARLTAAPTWSKEAKPRRVLLLLPFASVTAYSVSVDTIVATFREEGVAARFEIWLYDRDPTIAAEAVAWAEANSVDLIMPVGSDATEYLHKTYRSGRIPVVTSASKDPVLLGQMPDYHSGSGTDIAYTSNTVPVRLFVSYLRQLLPTLRVVAVLYDLSNRSAVETQVTPLHALAAEMGITVLDVPVRDAGHAKADLERGMITAADTMAGLDPDFASSAWIVTGSTSVYREIALIDRLGGRVPVVSMLPDVVQSGEASAAVSIGVNQSTAVQLAAHYAIDVLTGKAKVGELPVGVISPPDIAISFRAARRIGLKIPFRFLEAATFVYDYDGRQVLAFGQRVGRKD